MTRGKTRREGFEALGAAERRVGRVAHPDAGRKTQGICMRFPSFLDGNKNPGARAPIGHRWESVRA